MSRRRTALALYTLVALAWGLRLHRLAAAELWFDEAASYFIAAMDWQGILRYVAGAPFEHPPLYYLLLHATMAALGTTEWALRFPSALLGVLFVPALWRLTRPYIGQRVALLASVLAAVSPFLVTYGREARMYALVQLLGLLGTYLLLRLARSPRARLWLLYGVTMAAGLASHYFFAFLLLAHLAMLLALQRRPIRALHYLLAATCAAALAMVVWLGLAPGLRATATQIWREALWGKPGEAIARLFGDWAYGGAVISQRPTWWPLPAAALAVLAPLGLLHNQIPRRLRLSLALWVLVPTVCALAVPYGGLVLRHFSYVAPALLLLSAAGLLWLGQHGRVSLALAAIALSASVLPGLSWQYAQDKGDYGAALERVQRYSRPGDRLLFANPHQWVLAQYYNRTGLPTANVGDGWPLPSEELATAERVWLLEWETWALDDIVPLRDALRQQFVPAEERTYSTDLSLQLLYAAAADWPIAVPEAFWGGDRKLLGGGVNADRLLPGDAAIVDLRWQIDETLASNTALTLRLADEGGYVWAERTTLPAWSPGDGVVLTCRLALLLPGGTPPGAYSLQLGVVDLVTGASLSAKAADGVAMGPWQPLARIAMGRGAYSLPDSGEQGARRLGDGLSYLGNEADVRSLVAGERWRGVLQFRAERQQGEVTLRFALRGASGERPLGDLPLGTAGLPAAAWIAGEAWRCPYDLRLPEEVSPGSYSLVVRLYEDGRLLRPRGVPLLDPDYLLVDSFNVAARAKHVAESSPEHFADAEFGGQIRLTGYSIESDGEQLRLRLYWHALGPTAEPHKVFVHLTSADSSMPLAQDDAAPAETPTSDWIAGETFVSEHVLALPALDAGQSYVLRVGLYSERTMLRLSSSGADTVADHALIPLPRDG